MDFRCLEKTEKTIPQMVVKNGEKYPRLCKRSRKLKKLKSDGCAPEMCPFGFFHIEDLMNGFVKKPCVW